MRPRLLRNVARLLAAGTAIVTLGACSAGMAPAPADPLSAMRGAAARSSDGEAVGRWLLGELLVPGGTPAAAKTARQRLDALGEPAQKGLFASLARAVDDEAHGRFRAAASAHLDALAAARSSQSPDAPLVGWFSSSHLLGLRASVANLWADAHTVVETTIEHPGNVGWQTRNELVEWWVLDGYAASAAAADKAAADKAADDKLAAGKATSDKPSSDKADADKPSSDKPSSDKPAADKPSSDKPTDKATADKASTEKPSGVLEEAARRYGCVEKARMAGPFGHLSTSDHHVHFDAERAGPWPAVFPRDPLRKIEPRVLKVDRTGCALRPVGAQGNGIFYVETFIDLPAEREVIVSAQSAVAIFVDDTEVLTRDTRQWGIWSRIGARVRLEPGRHRILARVAGPETSIRLVTPQGMPLGVATSIDPAPPYAITPPEILEDPNVVAPFLDGLVPPQPRTPRPRAPRDTRDPVSRMLASYIAHLEGQDDVASVIIEPLVKDQSKATGPALALYASFVEKDPIFPPDQARDKTKDARALAAERDPDLWWPRFWLALDEADKAGLPEGVPKLLALSDRFREVPDILKGLSVIYGRLGWKVERSRIVKLAADRFPDDPEALQGLLHLYDEEGEMELADKVAARIKKLDHDAEVDFERAISRRDYRAAIKELERLGSIRKDRRDIAARIADLLTRAGVSRESMQKLEIAVQKTPADAQARLALADARLASGDRDALRKALIDSIQSGADTATLRDAIELVDGINELSPYRLDGKKVIAEYEASKQEMPGTAARVLDYSAVWIHPDGTARMLEHEIICIQSREGLEEQAEQRPRGLVLKLRTIKRDGRVLEPEIVEGKQTVTMPHLEVGDYIETETVANIRGDGQGGQRFEGPRWLFREAKVPYWRSEFIVVSPKDRPLDIETGGAVPKPQVTESGALSIHRWRVDQSPALPEEPASAPVEEFLPNVRVSWGITLKDTVARMVDAAADETPRDPRLASMAEDIISGKLPAKDAPSGAAAPKPAEDPAKGLSVDERARRIYRWVLARIEAGRESDPRRILSGRSGNRAEAFLYLCRLSGIEADRGIIKDKLAPPPSGPMSEAEAYGSMAIRLKTEKGPRWMVVAEKFAPYGYMPGSLRGQPAIVLKPGAPQETTPTEGSQDRMTQEGTAEMTADGSATIEIEQRFEGKLAILVRGLLETTPDARLKETVESRLVPQAFPGARVLSVDVKNLADIDAPLVLALKLEASNFARPRPGELVLSPPFTRQLGMLGALPTRETPLYISEQISMGMAMKLTIKLPRGVRVASQLSPVSIEDEGRTVRVNDRAEGNTLVLDRLMDIPVGRVQPEDYPRFQALARKGDAALHPDIVLSITGG